jgi:hypothetical protein
MLDEYQDVQSSQQHSVYVQEIDRDDPGRLGVQELPPGRTREARHPIDPAAHRISQTADGATVTPSFISSPWIRRCPAADCRWSCG